MIEFVVLFSVFLADKIIRKKKLFFQVLLAPEEKCVFMKISTCLGKENQHHQTMCHYTVIQVLMQEKYVLHSVKIS